MADVFISYSRDDEAVVRSLAEAVAREGYSVWWDEALPPHLSYSDVIAAEITKAKAVIVVWSEQAIASQWVRAEADLARNQNKLVQTSLDGRMPPMPFNQLHFVSIGDWRGEAGHPGWMRVKESLALLCRGKVTAPVHVFASPPPPRPVKKVPRFVPLLGGGLILLAAAGGAAFWFVRSEGVAPAASSVPDPSPKIGAPAAARRLARPRVTPRPGPAASVPTRMRVQPDKPQAGSTPVTTLRRYCSGPGRGTPRCGPRRARVSAARR